MAVPRKASITAADENVTSVLGRPGDHILIEEGATQDEMVLGALGYKQEFKRDFTIWESFSVSFSVLGLLPSVASTISYSLGYSGTGGAAWGWLASSICIQATAFSMAELCSSMPTAGGLYYASAVLAPEGWGPLASWFVGWSNFCGFVTGPCSVNYALASMLITCGMIQYPDYTPQTWHTYLVLLLLLIINGVITMQSTWFIGWVNKIGTVWNVIVILIFVIWFPVGSINHPKTNNSHDVWTQFENGTEWPIGWATIMGFLTSIWTMSGYDAPFHLSEECSNANISGPRAIVMTAQLGLYLGFAIILVIVYCVKDITDVTAGQYGQPFGSLCLQVLGKDAGLAMFALNIVAQFFVGVGCTITATRVIFAYSRDGAIVGSRYWKQIHPKTRTPVYATWGVLFVSALLGLLMFASPVAIGAVFSLGAIAQYTAFTTPTALKLFFDKGQFKPGPWNLGRWSSFSGAVAVGWWLVIVPALCFPAVKGKDLTPLTMNWTALIYGGTMLIALIYYAVSARKWFKGPRINVEYTHDEAEVLEGRVPQESAAEHEKQYQGKRD
ncbi:amino acid transporter-like protein [Exophiala viscosa]|uniref:Amino acid transporter-like protein n=1 Tax=Exophiala viscosa TaxID=2486360 RepID=A0AAN6IH63_9EURO|nr:amino acid transporter-like protein [Exophiala viscosa]KAI1626545.1 amino acid transporter-like protein [Exophiala viscosa]